MKVPDNTDAPWKDEEQLRQKYLVEGHTISELADLWDTSYDTIRYYKDKYDIISPPNNVSFKAHNLEREELYNHYWKENKSLGEIAAEYNCSETYILRKMRELEISRRVRDNEKIPDKWESQSTLSKLYWDKGLTLSEMADKIGCSAGTVSQLMERNGVARIDTPDEKPPNHRITVQGYETVRTKIGGVEKSVGVHQLVAIANGADPYKLFSGGDYHVHHKNHISWDNRPENLEVLECGEHRSIHYAKRETDTDGNLV
jgi:DNA-binding CsgD family transcriptional regulator